MRYSTLSPIGPAKIPATSRRARSRPSRGNGFAAVLAAAALLTLAACQGEIAPPTKKPAAVLSQVVEVAPFAPLVTLTGTIAARVESDLSFRFAGKIATRSVDVGDHVEPGDILATLSTEEQEADVDSARATLEAAEATQRQSKTNFDRQKQLLESGFTTKSTFDTAQETLSTAAGSVASAKADLASAEEQLAYTALKADAAGIITARNAEAGQVVDAAQTVFTLAQDGERDAIFDVYEAIFANEPGDDGKILVSLVSDPAVKATGAVREISPTFDTATGTVRVKVGLGTHPAAMTLGAAVSGAAHFKPHDAVVLPWTAFAAKDGKPSVWVVDPATKAVSQTPIVIDRYRTGEIVVRDGLKNGDVVVTAGAQLLREGETVSLTASSADGTDPLAVQTPKGKGDAE